MTTTERRDLTSEARWLPGTLGDATALRSAVRLLIATGCVPELSAARADSYADQLTGWLVGKVGGSDGRAAPTRAKYRRVLAELETRAGEATVNALGGRRGVYFDLQPVLAELEQLERLQLEQVGQAS